MVKVTDEILEWLGNMFVENNILDKHGVSFIVFVDEWKRGLLDKYDLV